MRYASAMRFGGSLVEAIECDYEDYKYLGLLCPECKDPVFLRAEGTRQQHGKEVKVGAHFCHFPGTDPSLIKQCEQRVSKYSDAEIQRAIAKARGQRLKLLQKWFWSVIESRYDFAMLDPKVTVDRNLQDPIAITCVDASRKFLLLKDESNFLDHFFHQLLEKGCIEFALNEEDRKKFGLTKVWLKKEQKRLVKLMHSGSSVLSNSHMAYFKESVDFLLSKSSVPMFDLIAFDCFHEAAYDHSQTHYGGDPFYIDGVLANRFSAMMGSSIMALLFSIPWADEFAKLQKQSAKEAA